jgi:hypothetical protein
LCRKLHHWTHCGYIILTFQKKKILT